MCLTWCHEWDIFLKIPWIILKKEQTLEIENIDRKQLIQSS